MEARTTELIMHSSRGQFRVAEKRLVLLSHGKIVFICVVKIEDGDKRERETIQFDDIQFSHAFPHLTLTFQFQLCRTVKWESYGCILCLTMYRVIQKW